MMNRTFKISYSELLAQMAEYEVTKTFEFDYTGYDIINMKTERK